MENSPTLETNEAYSEPMNELETLTNLDRCDGCAAQAMRRVELASGGELLFCVHHYEKHSDALAKAEARVIEEVMVPA